MKLRELCPRSRGSARTEGVTPRTSLQGHHLLYPLRLHPIPPARLRAVERGVGGGYQGWRRHSCARGHAEARGDDALLAAAWRMPASLIFVRSVSASAFASFSVTPGRSHANSSPPKRAARPPRDWV